MAYDEQVVESGHLADGRTASAWSDTTVVNGEFGESLEHLELNGLVGRQCTQRTTQYVQLFIALTNNDLFGQ